MIRILFLGVLLLVGAPKLQAQFELKTNVFSAVGGFAELSGEWAGGEHSAFGVTLGVEYANGDNFINNDGLVPDTFSVIPYYRYYFGSQDNSSGFFLEGNLAIYEYDSGFDENDLSFGGGLAIGDKILFESGWLLEFFVGGGFAFIQDENTFAPDSYPRIGVGVGKRF